jgi:SAM-dependent methyltransferase
VVAVQVAREYFESFLIGDGYVERPTTHAYLNAADTPTSMDYREALLLRAARESGILEAVTTSAGTPEAVAEETGVTLRAARITVEALADLGFLEAVGDEYEPTNRALGFLATADVRSVGSLPHELDCLEAWIDLPETMRTGEPPGRPDDWTTHFVGAMATIDEATVRACVTEAVHSQPDAERVINVGGGPGRFATEFARRGFDVTLFDRPEVVEVVQPSLAHQPVELRAGDFLEGNSLEGVPGEFDLAFCARVAHGLDPDENRRLLANVHDALAPDGTAVVVDYLRGKSERASMFAAHMLAQTERGDVYTAEQFTEWLADAGFEQPRIGAIPGTDLRAVAASKRGVD